MLFLKWRWIMELSRPAPASEGIHAASPAALALALGAACLSISGEAPKKDLQRCTFHCSLLLAQPAPLPERVPFPPPASRYRPRGSVVADPPPSPDYEGRAAARRTKFPACPPSKRRPAARLLWQPRHGSCSQRQFTHLAPQHHARRLLPPQQRQARAAQVQPECSRG